MAKLLIVDDDQAMLRLCQARFPKDWELIATNEPEQTLALALEHRRMQLFWISVPVAAKVYSRSRAAARFSMPPGHVPRVLQLPPEILRRLDRSRSFCSLRGSRRILQPSASITISSSLPPAAQDRWYTPGDMRRQKSTPQHNRPSLSRQVPKLPTCRSPEQRRFGACANSLQACGKSCVHR